MLNSIKIEINIFKFNFNWHIIFKIINLFGIYNFNFLFLTQIVSDYR